MSGGAFEPGAVVGDRYRLRRRLGEGGMGWVWEASHVHTHARFALKFLKGAKEDDRRRFQREVRAAAAVRHPNVIGVHDFVELPNGTLVMVMDLLEGETLGAVLRRERRIALPDLAATLLPVVSALEAAHAVGVVHRDLKPDNIFLSESEGNDIVVKVLDFGVAKLTAVDGLAARTQALTGTGSMVGTPYYMSPEQVVSEKDLDARADIWSLGVVMYECLAGVRPTEADNVGRVLKRILLADFQPITQHCAELPDEVSSLVMRMLIGDRETRTRDLAEVRALLVRHAAERVPASARLLATEPSPSEQTAGVDAHADTVAAPSERPDAKARGETHHALSLGASPPPRTRTRLVGGALVFLGAAGALGWSLASRTTVPSPSTVATLTLPTATPDPSLAPSAAASADASASASASPSLIASAPLAAPLGAQRPSAAPPRRPALAASTSSPSGPPPSPLASAPVASASASPPSPAASEAPKPSPGFAKSRKD